MTSEIKRESEIVAGTGIEKPVFLFHGEDDLARDTAAREIVDRLCAPEERAFGLEVFDGDCSKAEEAVEVLRQTSEALYTAGFLEGRKTVWLRAASFLDNGPLARTERVKSAVNRLGESLKRGLPAGRHLIVSAAKVFKSSSFFKACREVGCVYDYELSDKPYERMREMPAKVQKFCRERDLLMDEDTVRYLLTRCTPEPRQLQQECEKLSLHLGPGGRATKETVELMVAPSSEAMFWDLTDAIGDRDTARALRLARNLTFKESAGVYLVMMLERYLRDLLVLKECLVKRWLVIEEHSYGKAHWNEEPEASAFLDAVYAASPRQDPRKKHPYALRLMAQKTSLFNRRELRHALDATVKTHEDMVSRALSPRLQLEMLVLRITTPDSATRRRR